MNASGSARAVPRAIAAMLAVVAFSAVAGFGAGSAAAHGSGVATSAGSVPEDVTRFIADGLIPAIDDLYGPGAGGVGIEFDETTTVGTPYRVFVFTDEFLAGEETETPTRRINEWAVVVSVADAPVGLATIGIDEATSAAVLALFEPDAALASALVTVPDDAALVRDGDVSGWFTLAGDTLSPLVAGESGLDAPSALAGYQALVADRAEPAAAPPESNGGLVAGVVLGVVILVIAAFLLLPRRSRPEPERPRPVE